MLYFPRDTSRNCVRSWTGWTWIKACADYCCQKWQAPSLPSVKSSIIWSSGEGVELHHAILFQLVTSQRHYPDTTSVGQREMCRTRIFRYSRRPVLGLPNLQLRILDSITFLTHFSMIVRKMDIGLGFPDGSHLRLCVLFLIFTPQVLAASFWRT